MSGRSLPSLDNLIILSRILHISMEDILVVDGDVVFLRVLNQWYNDLSMVKDYDDIRNIIRGMGNHGREFLENEKYFFALFRFPVVTPKYMAISLSSITRKPRISYICAFIQKEMTNGEGLMHQMRMDVKVAHGMI